MLDKSPLELYLLIVFVLFSGFVVLAAYASNDTGLASLGRRYHISADDGVVVAIVSILIPAVLALYGSVSGLDSLSGMGRYEFRSNGLALLFNWGLVTAGLFSFASAYNHLSVYRRLRRSKLSTGTVCAVSGVTTGTPGTSPVGAESALCWTWRFEVQNRFGTSNEGWTVTEIGSGGVPFRVQTDAGDVYVDPGEPDTRFSLVGASRRERQPGERLAEDIVDDSVREADTEYREKTRRYVEALVTPGSAVTVTGYCVERAGERWMTSSQDAELFVSEGGKSATLFRYRFRLATALLVGAGAFWLGISYLSGFFGL